MATMKDVARLAGVSTSTVSHVINNNRYVSEKIKKRVNAAIEELNYTPSALARSLKIKQTKTIGMLVTSSDNSFYSEVVRGVEQSCYERGYSLILHTEGNLTRMLRCMETLLQKRVDGLLIMCSEQQLISKDFFLRYPLAPIVTMDWSPFDVSSDVIKDNSLLGGELATNYLISRGFRKIACIAGPQDKMPAQQRLFGYRKAMRDAGLEISEGYEIYSNFEFSGGFLSMKQLLQLPEPPEAVFASNDAMAIGVYQALYQSGLSVPKDISVIGYDDIAIAPYLTPPLTTIHQSKGELGKLAIDTLLYRMDNPESEPKELILTPALVERSSVARR
ncbi:ribose operon transcriptional repressor RbsR [Xenorhabdus nematophila]|nr:ribose operon transcriptional repressor RbsR [Xenorhabdus nematophila]CEF28415.1 transcriptional repressor for ribose metabolism (GalR/LacI family) [Xenorhabdus nematophila str. Websteri]AYA41643.1 transcriptional regulator RbsR [Xenorhabdus nematophila]MBA0020380.1 ribose operon transcriptional repressor RbsR [Xenorhabdus nematophila]MCB4424623.1 ribose operon transcriptional repressor RbsR [Xenorhabdus nematophila]QNJ36027.1 ribose operon transcriptional repressor RbsR [Xenorhabdus nemato